MGDCAGASGDQDGKRAPLCNAGAVDRVAALVGVCSTAAGRDGMTDGVGAIASGEEIAPRRAARCNDGWAGGAMTVHRGEVHLARS